MAVSTEDLEAQLGNDDLVPDAGAAGEQPPEDSDEGNAADLQAQDQQLARQESATQASLDNLQRQLSRMEARYDKGGTDAVSIRQIRQEIGTLHQQLDGIGELRELVDGLLEANVPPEKLAALKVKQAETRATRANKRAQDAEEAAARVVNLTPTPQPDAAEAAAIEEAAALLSKRMVRAGLDPNDNATLARLQGLVPGLASMGVHQRLNALTEAIADLAEAAAGSAARDGRQAAARGAVRTDRTAGGGAASSSTTYKSHEDLAAALYDNKLTVAQAGEIARKNGWA